MARQEFQKHLGRDFAMARWNEYPFVDTAHQMNLVGVFSLKCARVSGFTVSGSAPASRIIMGAKHILFIYWLIVPKGWRN